MLFLLCACAQKENSAIDSKQKYMSYISVLQDQNIFSGKPEHFDVSAEMSRIDGGYRYYITIDQPRTSMYDIMVIAVEDDVDYSETMAACSGIFDSKYNMVPNQTKTDLGFVKGIVISGTSTKKETVLKLFVEYKNSDGSKVFNDFIEIPVSAGE